MPEPHSHWTYDSSTYDDDVADDPAIADAYRAMSLAPLSAGERIGAPLKPKKGGRRWLRWSFRLLLCLGGFWAVRDDTGTVPALMSEVKTALAPVIERVATALAPLPAAPPPAPVAAAPAPEPPPLPPQAEVAPAHIPAASVAVQSPPAVGPPETEPATPARPQPLPPPTVDQTNPYQKRAAAIGLHPGISPAVLKLLSAADYRNGATAIEKALGQAPDDEIFVWPRPAKADLALYQIRFVQGSNADCRRYVVNVTKDGWSTTAPAMEKCGLRAPAARAAAK